MSGSHLSSTEITSYDKNLLRIEVELIPPALKVGESCKLLILTSPTPCEYHGRVAREGTRNLIGMFKGQEREQRGAERYSLKLPALIEELICDMRAYTMHTPLEVELVNISKSGVRFTAPFYSLTDGDRFRMRLRISDKDKQLIAEVTNHFDKDSEVSEYGCRFITGG